jgi:hypothetical protein
MDCSVLLRDVKTEVLKVADINNCDKESTQFTPDASGMLTAFAHYDNGHSSMCPKPQDTATVNSTVIKCSHNKGQNVPEEHTNEDDANAVAIHHSLQEASSHSTVLLPWTDEFSDSINCKILFSNWEQ